MNTRNLRYIRALMLGAAGSALIPGIAQALTNQTGVSTLPDPRPVPTVQTPDQAAEATLRNKDAGGEEIVVTGTPIRGIAPAGNNVVGLTSEQWRRPAVRPPARSSTTCRRSPISTRSPRAYSRNQAPTLAIR